MLLEPQTAIGLLKQGSRMRQRGRCCESSVRRFLKSTELPKYGIPSYTLGGNLSNGARRLYERGAREPFPARIEPVLLTLAAASLLAVQP